MQQAMENLLWAGDIKQNSWAFIQEEYVKIPIFAEYGNP